MWPPRLILGGWDYFLCSNVGYGLTDNWAISALDQVHPKPHSASGLRVSGRERALGFGVLGCYGRLRSLCLGGFDFSGLGLRIGEYSEPPFYFAMSACLSKGPSQPSSFSRTKNPKPQSIKHPIPNPPPPSLIPPPPPGSRPLTPL